MIIDQTAKLTAGLVFGHNRQGGWAGAAKTGRGRAVASNDTPTSAVAGHLESVVAVVAEVTRTCSRSKASTMGRPRAHPLL